MSSKQSVSLKQRLQQAYDYFYYLCPFILMSPGERLFLVLLLSSVLSLVVYSAYKSIVNIHQLASVMGVYKAVLNVFGHVSLDYDLIRSPLMDQILNEYDSTGSANSSSFEFQT